MQNQTASKLERHYTVLKAHEDDIFESIRKVYIDIRRADERLQEKKPNRKQHKDRRLCYLLGNEQGNEPNQHIPNMQSDGSDPRERWGWTNQIIEGKNDQGRKN